MIPQARLTPHWQRPSVRWIGLAFGLSVLVHVLTFFSVDASRWFPPIWGLHLAAMAGFGAMLLNRRWRPAGVPADLFRLPLWVLPTLFGIFLYAGANFTLFIKLTEGGTPETGPSGYFLSDHGQVIRTLTEAEYFQQKAYILRGFSGHWIAFLAIALAYFLYVPDDMPPEGAAAGAG